MGGKYYEIDKCRISGSKNLIEILDLGTQSLTGIFPSSSDQNITKGPLNLLWCPDSGLVQLKQTYNLNEMYGNNYGYRSSLNRSMVKHLKNKANALSKLCEFSNGDIIIDIGSNDGTFLGSFKNINVKKIGIDPSGSKFKKYYPNDVELIPEFFPSETFQNNYGNEKIKLITSIAMLYDLESPAYFVKKISEILDLNGIWHFEQSYLPTMMEMNAYDTICHEHLEYYTLNVINKLLQDHGLKIVDVEFNSVNGGSFAVSATTMQNESYKVESGKINGILKEEEKMGLNTKKPYQEFSERVKKHRKNLINLLEKLKRNGEKVLGYGASTKGNVLLQYGGISRDLIPYIAEVNPEKYGCFTPGTRIPIISEKDAHEMKPDYFLVLPWHFKKGILEKENKFRSSGGKFIFPLPKIEII